MEIFISLLALAGFGYFLWTRIDAARKARAERKANPSPYQPRPREDRERNLD